MIEAFAPVAPCVLTGGLAGASDDPGLPAEVALILSALDAGAERDERRAFVRVPFRSSVMLRLFGGSSLLTSKSSAYSPGVSLFSRDLSPTGVGYISRKRLPLGARGVLELPAAGGQLQRMQCTVARCRPLNHEWFEGCVLFCQKLLGPDQA